MSQDGLFPRLAPTVREVARKLIPVGYGYCPECYGNGKALALYRQGAHVVWREHTYRTWDDTKRTCRASGVAICLARPRFAVHTCPCQEQP